MTEYVSLSAEYIPAVCLSVLCCALDIDFVTYCLLGAVQLTEQRKQQCWAELLNAKMERH